MGAADNALSEVNNSSKNVFVNSVSMNICIFASSVVVSHEVVWIDYQFSSLNYQIETRASFVLCMGVPSEISNAL